MTTENRVWIELEPPKDNDPVLAQKRCELANRMLNKLSAPEETIGRGFSWSATENKYRFNWGMKSTILKDNGEWFDLDFLGREVSASSHQ